MIALRVYDTAGTPYYIDLYEEEGVKLNFSIEDITSTDAKSTFSRTFRVPSTGTNNEFFKMAFLVDGIDFDVTVKVPAEIEVGGAFFRGGHVRLQKIYRNEDLDGIDYELLFLGETRDFASVLGEAPLCELDGSSLTHVLNYANIVASWNAYPEGALLTDGLLNGDVLYPLIDHGNTYDSSGNPEQATIKTNTSQHAFSFTQNSHPIFANRFKPMIRAKKVIDLIFDSTPYTYSSNFISSAFFHKIYVSAFGNEASVYNQVGQSDNIFKATQSSLQIGTAGGYEIVPCNNEIYDTNSNYNNTGTPPPADGFAYTAPITGAYTFYGRVDISTQPDWGTGTSYGRAVLRVNGSNVDFGGWVSSPGTGTSSLTWTGALTAGDYVQLWVETSPNTDQSAFEDGLFQCTSAPGIAEPTFQLDCEYKQVDFLKDILKLFRCVMAPDKDNPNNFIIEPWADYITSGDLHDWSDKVDRTKDFQIEPLFFTQSDRIEFKFKEDEDWLNKYNQDSFKQVYGQLNFDSGNELLKDTRDITVGFSPTPTQQIEGDPVTSDWIIPQIHLHDTEGGTTQHLPMKANTRILFYNGEHPTTDTWYFNDGTTVHAWSTYPAVGYQEGYPPLNLTGLNLNWEKWFAYYGDQVSGWNEYAGVSLFDRYWSGYIASLYNKFARRVTCNVILNSVDLQDFSFDDVIYIDGTYYRPEKIIDAPIGQKESVRVQLIKLLDYRPDAPDLPPVEDWCYYVAGQVNATCTAVSSTFVVLQAPCALNLGPGDNVSVVGQSLCYQIVGPASTTVWDYTVIDNFGPDCNACNSSVTTPQNLYWVRQYGETCNDYILPWITVSSVGTASVGDVVSLSSLSGCWEVVGLSAGTPVDSIAASYPDCLTCLGTPTTYHYNLTRCDGSASTTASYSAPLSNGQAVLISGNAYCWQVVGITSASLNTITAVYDRCESCEEANPPVYRYLVENCDNPGGGGSLIVESAVPISPTQVVSLNGRPGCWFFIANTLDPAFDTVNTVYDSCEICEGNTYKTYLAEQCGGGRYIIVDALGQALQNGQSIVTIQEPETCYQIISTSNQPPTHTLQNGPNVFSIWDDCRDCNYTNGTNGKNWLLRNCNQSDDYRAIGHNATFVLGYVVTIVEVPGECYELVGPTSFASNSTLNALFDNCPSCIP